MRGARLPLLLLLAACAGGCFGAPRYHGPRSDHFDDVRQQIRLHRLGAGAVPDQLETFLALKPGQLGFELGDRVPGADRQRDHGHIAPDRRQARINHVAAGIGDAAGDRQQGRLRMRGVSADQQMVFVGGGTRGEFSAQFGYPGFRHGRGAVRSIGSAYLPRLRGRK